MHSGNIHCIHFEKKCSHLSFPAKQCIKLHQFLADPQPSVPGINTDIEELRFISHNSETDKTHHVIPQKFFHFDDETVGGGMVYLFQKHSSGPGAQEGQGGQRQNCVQIIRSHSSHDEAFHQISGENGRLRKIAIRQQRRRIKGSAFF
jgi:hypothetical protein